MTGRWRYPATAALGALLLSPFLAATAAENPDAPTPTIAPASPQASSTEITLITGDRVHVATGTDGRLAVTVEPADRADGVTPAFSTHEIDGHVFVIPSDVSAHVPERLDRALFDVTLLSQEGFDDASTDSVPVIVDYGDTVPSARASTGLPGVEVTRALPSIGAVAADVDKATAADLGAALAADVEAAPAGQRTTAAIGQVEKIWLDGPVEATLDESVPQIGAPTLWDQGFTGDGVRVAVLDTGIDTTHPDLAGKVVAEANFSAAAEVTDRHGHGTHVAATVAGSGAASDGARKGVAYDADLLNGKVLDDGGSGTLSGVVAGMEWAATNGADIVNLSLGVRGLYTDGTDPTSQAVNELSAEHGTLFVIAAGNEGPSDGTVTSPGAADSALTVGAVDKNDVLAGFSSRGPRAGDFALKPDVTAPGVDIVSARAAGTSMGAPVDEYYTSSDGTSMATPHVVGAAALLLQQRPDLTGPELKSLLASTAVPGEFSVYEQGAGRIDLTQATSASILPDVASLSLGYFPYPHDDATAVTRTLTYRNLGDTEATLALDLELTDADGAAAADGMVTLGADTVTVPAGGTADVTVTVDPSIGDYGLYGGYLTATDQDGTVTRTTTGFYKESERYNLTVTGIARDGRPAAGISMVDVINVDDRDLFMSDSNGFIDGTATFRVPPGNYAINGYLFTYDEPHVYAEESAAVLEPEVTITGDTQIELDARSAVPIEVDTPETSAPEQITLSYWRQDALGSSYSHSFILSAPTDEAFATPTEGSVTVGDFEFFTGMTLTAPPITMTVTEPEEQHLDVLYALGEGAARLDGSYETELVHAGLGTVEDYESIDVTGKIALVQRGELTFAEKIANAAAAGAIAIVIYNNAPGLLLIGSADELPTLAMKQADGEALVALMQDGALDISVEAVGTSPFLYETLFPEPGQVPADLSYTLSKANAATVDARYRSHVEDHGLGELRHRWRPWQVGSIGFLRRMQGPLQRDEMVSANDTRWAHYFYGNSADGNPFGYSMQDDVAPYQARSSVTENFLTQAAAPSLWPGAGDTAFREDGLLTMQIPEWGDPDGHWGDRISDDSTSFRLYEDGDLVAEGERARGQFQVGTDADTYRIELDVQRDAPWWTMSTATSTTWTVNSPAPGADLQALPLLRARVSTDLDMLNRAARKRQRLTIAVDHQPGSTDARVEGARVWASTDDGDTWKELRVRRDPRHGFRADLDRLDPQAEFVSLRVEAWDADGNRIEQEVMRAYGLK